MPRLNLETWPNLNMQYFTKTVSVQLLWNLGKLCSFEGHVHICRIHFFSGSYAPFELKIWPKLTETVSLKLLYRITCMWSFVVMKNIPCWWFDSIFFLGVSPLLNLKKFDHKLNILLKVSLKWLNRISWNLVVEKDILCTCAYSQGIILIWFFFWENN